MRGRSIIVVAAAVILVAAAGRIELGDRTTDSGSLSGPDEEREPASPAILSRAVSAPPTQREPRNTLTREILLVLRCETLRHNVIGAWRHMKLRVRVEDDRRRHLAECREPWNVERLSLPANVDRITLVASGYKRKQVRLPEASGGADQLVVFLEPDAKIHVRAKNLPSAPGNEFAIGVRLATGIDDSGHRELAARVQRQSQEAQHGELAAVVKIPSGVASKFFVARTRTAAGDRAGFAALESKTIELVAGEERVVVLDFTRFGVLEGRLTGVPLLALENQVIDAGGTEAVVDADGRFRIVGLADRPVGLRLRTQGGDWPALVGVEAGRRTWRPGEQPGLVVAPEAAVNGVVPVKGARLLGQPFQVQVNGPPDARDLRRRVPLFSKALLERLPLFFFVPGVGHFERSLAGARAGPDGLYRVEVPRPGGAIVARFARRPEGDVQLFARPVHEVENGTAVSFTAERVEGEWRFEGLPAGDYELVVHYRPRSGSPGSRRAVRDTVAVESGQRTKVTVAIPDLIEVRGRIANWSEIPSALRPDWLSVVHGEQPHAVRPGPDGSFRVKVLGPRARISEVVFFNRHQVTGIRAEEITPLSRELRFSVTFPPSVRERWLIAKPLVGGRMWIQPFAGDGRSSSPSSRELRPESGGRFLVAMANAGVDGVLLEHSRHGERELRILRGWFRLQPGGPEQVQLELGGRWVEVVLASPSGSATLTVTPPAWWRHGHNVWASLSLEGAQPRQLWLPDAANGVIVDGKHEIPAARIGDRLVIGR